MWYYFFMENLIAENVDIENSPENQADNMVDENPAGANLADGNQTAVMPVKKNRLFEWFARHMYLCAFFAGFLLFALIAVPSVLFSKGVWMYYGDFNVQQIPFYLHVHKALKNGQFLYDFGTDLGGSLIGCYSFYLLGSPFFWITLLFETDIVPFLMPWISALKYGVMTLTAFAFLKRHLKTDAGAFMGAMLYAFSGFQGAVLVYNHFHDVMAFFPLYLLLFELMIEKKKTIGFTLMTAFMLSLNYYFFVGEAVFLVIYYFCMFAPYREKLANVFGELLRAFISGLAGVLLAGAYILPAIAYTLGNNRITQVLSGYDLVSYSEPTMFWNLLKNIVMLPDLSGLNSMLNQSYSRVSGIGAYIPLFSIAGVVAYYRFHRERDRYKNLMTVCAVFALVPGLNALFSALNSEYYARWFYMPVLIMALLTASVLEKRSECQGDLRFGGKVVLVITVIIMVMAVLPAKTEDEVLTVLGALKNYEQLLCEFVFSAIMAGLLLLFANECNKMSVRTVVATVIISCYITTCTMFISGTMLCDSNRKEPFLKQAVFGESPLEEDGNFYRIETDEDFYNYGMLWDDVHSITAFISTVPDSVFAFYKGADLPRKVSSHPYTSRIGARTLLSGRYYLTNNEKSIEYIGRVEDMTELKDYSLVGEKNGFNIYENANYIPMGFSFDYYITEKEYEESEAAKYVKDRMLLKALVLSDEVSEDLSVVLSHMDISKTSSITLGEFSKSCNERRETVVSDFEYTHKGFSAKTDYDKARLVFFSVPYEKGFTAYVDGNETKIYKVDFGLMGVCVPAGEHRVEFSFLPTYYKEGLYMSLAGILLFLLILGKNLLTGKRGCVKLT